MQKNNLTNSTFLHDLKTRYSQQLGKELNPIKGIYKKPIANIIVNDALLDAFPLRVEIRQKCHLSAYFFNNVLDVLVSLVSQQKETKNLKVGREKLKLFN